MKKYLLLFVLQACAPIVQTYDLPIVDVEDKKIEIKTETSQLEREEKNYWSPFPFEEPDLALNRYGSCVIVLAEDENGVDAINHSQMEELLTNPRVIATINKRVHFKSNKDDLFRYLLNHFFPLNNDKYWHDLSQIFNVSMHIILFITNQSSEEDISRYGITVIPPATNYVEFLKLFEQNCKDD